MSVMYDYLKDKSDLRQYSIAIQRRARAKRYLKTVYLQLIPLCNLNCRMCYARMAGDELTSSGKHVLSFTEWKWYIDQIVEMGVLDLVITGGECTIHPEFKKIYAYAYDKGLEMNIMTNCSFIDDELFELWMEKPPACISVTVYGGSFDTYKKLCGKGSAYKQVFRNIERLREKNFFLKLKYTVVRENIDDLFFVHDYFYKRKQRLIFDQTLMNFNKCTENVIEAEQVSEAEIESKRQVWYNKNGLNSEKNVDDVALYERTIKIMSTPDDTDKGLRCSAGRSACHITWEGLMTPCVSFDAFSIDPKKLGFRESWEKLVSWSDEVPRLTECEQCLFQWKCKNCVAVHYNDLKEFGKPSPRLCWKRNHSEEAERIQKELIKKGILKSET